MTSTTDAFECWVLTTVLLLRESIITFTSHDALAFKPI